MVGRGFGSDFREIFLTETDSNWEALLSVFPR